MAPLARFAAALVIMGATTACATARIHSDPPGARLYVNGLYMGTTPFNYGNEAGLPRRYHIQLVKEGYRPLDLYIDARMSWLWGYLGAFTGIPLLFAWSLSGDYVFYLEPATEEDAPPAPSVPREPDAEPDRDRIEL